MHWSDKVLGWLALGWLVLMSLAGCAVDSTLAAAPSVPAAYSTESSGSDSADAARLDAFHSAELDRLLQLARYNSLDIAQAVARVQQADARARQVGAALLPQLDASGSAIQLAGGAHGKSASETDWSALLSASYEIDFWGRNRAARGAALALSQASRADRDTVQLTVSCAVAATYFDILSLRERQAAAEANVRAASDVLGYFEARSAAGDASAAELAAQRAALASAQLVVPHLAQQEAEMLAALSLLVGQMPEGFGVEARSLDGLTEPQVQAGLPSSLLVRRPDLREAQHNLLAARGDLDAARAALYPAINLTAGGGIADPALQAAVLTLAGTGYSLSLGANIVQTIFDAGRRRALTEEARARESELLSAYRKAVLNALVDVETALAQIHFLNLQAQSQHDAIEQSRLSYDGSALRFREGADGFLAVLEAQRAWYAAQDQFSQYRLAKLQASLNLMKALGND